MHSPLSFPVHLLLDLHLPGSGQEPVQVYIIGYVQAKQEEAAGQAQAFFQLGDVTLAHAHALDKLALGKVGNFSTYIADALADVLQVHGVNGLMG